MNDPIEEALRTYPMTEVPADFSKEVIRRVRFARTLRGFHLTWMDYALGLFLSLLPILGFVVWVFLPREFFMRLQYQWLIFRSPAYEPILLATLAVVGIFTMLALFASVGFINRPRKFGAR